MAKRGRPPKPRSELPPPLATVCESCGCWDRAACRVMGVPCCWVEGGAVRDLCSACVPIDVLIDSPAGLAWLKLVMAEVERRGVPPEGCFQKHDAR